MVKTMLTGKIHRATATHSELGYEGSCAIDADLLAAAGIAPFERIEIYNVSNGERFATYAIEAESGSGIVSVNGAAARKAAVGDTLIVACYAGFEAEEAAHWSPKLVYVDGANKIARIGHAIPVQGEGAAKG